MSYIFHIWYKSDMSCRALFINVPRLFIALKDNTTLQCDKLIWSGSDKDIVGEGNVRINRNRELISKGNKVIINSDYSHFKLVGKTRSELYDKEHKMSKEKKL